MMPLSGYLTAVLAGLGGAAHCAAMCGPLTVALGMADVAGDGSALKAAIGFNLGRLTAYAVAGAGASALMGSVLVAADLVAFTTAFRLLAAAVIGILGLALLGLSGMQAIDRALAPLWRLLRHCAAPLFRSALVAPRHLRPFFLGLLWLFMPCGLVLSMLLIAATRESVAGAVLFMLSFGVGTMPAVLSLSMAGTRVAQWLRRPAFRRSLGALLLVAGAMGAVMTLHHHSNGPDPHAHHHGLM